MRLKNFVQRLYVFGETANTYDVARGGDDIVTGVKKAEAQRLISLVNAYADMIDWMYGRLSEADRAELRGSLENKP